MAKRLILGAESFDPNSFKTGIVVYVFVEHVLCAVYVFVEHVLHAVCIFVEPVIHAVYVFVEPIIHTVYVFVEHVFSNEPLNKFDQQALVMDLKKASRIILGAVFAPENREKCFKVDSIYWNSRRVTLPRFQTNTKKSPGKKKYPAF